MRWLPLALLGVNFFAIRGDPVSGSSLTIGEFVDTAACYTAIDESVAGKDGDQRMDPESYVGFVKAYGPDNFLEDTSTFEELPLILINNFYLLACMCGKELDDECCVGEKAGIETNGALSGEIPTNDEKSYLFLVCAQTSTAIERVVDSLSPSASPVPSPPDDSEKAVTVTYTIGVENEIAVFEDYDEELISAMDSMAPTLLSDVRKRQLRVGRNLQSIFLPTTITDHSTIDCPTNLIKPAFRCESITASVVLLFQPMDEDPTERAANFETVLSDAIFAGDLQEFLESSSVFIVDVDALEPGDETPGGGNSAGIAAGAIFGVALLATIIYFVRGSRGEENVVNSSELNIDPLQLDSGSKVDDPSVHDGGDASSSNAGSSGWSSSAGIDSMNTNSADGLEFEKSTIPAITTSTSPLAKTSGIAGQADAKDELTSPKVTRHDLDTAIEEGDWAAVGATAALLAAASDSQSYSSKSEQYTGTRSRSGSSVSSLDVARAAELDHLVDAGDWEGVVLAAAKYEGDESKGSLPSASISGSDTRSNADTAGQTADSSVGSSKGLKQQEYRAIVEDLVQRVVPEEIQNVDEMMLQFRGREDELVETLRTMQERAVAQKAQKSSQTAAKQQAKLSSAKAKSENSVTAKSSKSIGKGQVSAAIATSKSLGTGEVESTPKKKEQPKDNRPKGKSKPDQNALEAAIEAGDWDAVGEEAALLTDSNSMTSADTDEINRLADGISTDGSSIAGSKNLADVADELEELIEAGDWTGVVQAASSKGSSIDKNTESKETRRLRRLKHLQEEQEALAQAEIWTAIAEQSKQEAETTDQGAADAADWAISRSLNALVEAELSGINDQSTVGTDGDSLHQSTIKDDDESGNEV
eukprot:CAMPEP_0116116244 /NCGR_PEP_ID=MMETSP0329-20121206/934_1 /TAXON_ID=697910 /ORGANISM="Pseudo-nitzschia arenysensis, Strain B593" /LENGTH=872 /DNA_ID=CAMNT_0003609725 /DNA_START=149 /DNA_END=2767 /DNA_ORIENTATION=-